MSGYAGTDVPAVFMLRVVEPREFGDETSEFDGVYGIAVLLIGDHEVMRIPIKEYIDWGGDGGQTPLEAAAAVLGELFGKLL